MAAADELLASQFGVSAQIVESLRKSKLTEGEHWLRETCGKVVILPSGLALLTPLLDPQKKEKGGGEEAKKPIPLPIARIHPNRTWVRVRLPDNTGVDVRVRNNTRLKERMQILCLQREDGRWECQHPGQAIQLAPLASQAQTETAAE